MEFLNGLYTVVVVPSLTILGFLIWIGLHLLIFIQGMRLLVIGEVRWGDTRYFNPLNGRVIGILFVLISFGPVWMLALGRGFQTLAQGMMGGPLNILVRLVVGAVMAGLLFLLLRGMTADLGTLDSRQKIVRYILIGIVAAVLVGIAVTMWGMPSLILVEFADAALLAVIVWALATYLLSRPLDSAFRESERLGKFYSGLVINGVLFVVCLLWTIPTFGLLVSSFRERTAIQTSGWWTVLPHVGWTESGELPIPQGATREQQIEIEGVSATFDEWTEGIETEPGRRLIWTGNLRNGRIVIEERRLTADLNLTLDNYGQVLAGKEFTIEAADGTSRTVQGDNFVGAFLNTLTVAVPSTVIPILIAAFAAYGFAWMNFPGRGIMFILVVALLVVPLQIALVPILRDYVRLELNGTFLSVWLAHTGFGLPLATYLLYNYISTIPRDILESAFIDGASHFTIFLRLILPLSLPALASFAIFQFLWVWNDYLVALIFIGVTNSEVQVMTQRIQEMVGSRGQDWHLLTAAAFISMIVPLAVFFSLQRYFVRGLMAGSVKG